MRFDLGPDDRRITSYLVSRNLMSETEALVYVLLLTRPLGLNKANLADLLALYRYKELGNKTEISKAIDSLLEKNFFLEGKQGITSRIVCSPLAGILDDILKKDPDDEETDKIKKIVGGKKQELKEYLIEDIGWANCKYAADTYFDSLSGASKSIKLPVFSLATHERGKEAIREAVKRGVNVRILMFSPKLALNAHGYGRDIEVHSNAKLWRDMSKELKGSLGSLEVRFVKDLEYSYAAGALLVDGQVFRYDLYYPKIQRGHEGYMIQGRCFDGEMSNLHHIIEHYFDNAWASAAKAGAFSAFLEKMSRVVSSLTGIVLVTIGILTLNGEFPILNQGKIDYGLFFIGLGLMSCISAFKTLYNWLKSFELRKRQK